MSTKTPEPNSKLLWAYDREMLRSAFVSLFWAIITERRKKGTFTLVQLAKQLGANKGEVSRWFKGQPNWTVGTIANIANALNVELRIEAVDRVSGEVFTPAGIQHVQQRSSAVFPAPSSGSGDASGARTPRAAALVTSADIPTSAVRFIRAPEGINQSSISSSASVAA
jgi:transcriptional regulator with XRE-family HTH domain